ncbi:MarR family winged helix-turn-helix transcriptional regulator [Herbaspirillum sp. VT-16-41]|uniref:MarR family winged helix-turn-helix transcriptional regulator n=1 Tax=Herbaspirillum sp. VT-16-41 TaxID=1953765 RepID=UPI000982620D|nr:MarR family transcriptional regulator [Herbaspirillum sp. VT-16-41]ONN65845.1 MarR family transcriptional regulator [Herbaspirillum sp. VT-16-41]
MDVTPKKTRKPARPAIPASNDAWRATNLGRLLNQAVQRFEESVLAKMVAAGHGQFTQSHISVTRNLDVQGTRATEIAKRASITKQSLGELVLQLEKLGIVMREPDPSDGRAKIVRFTPQGMLWLEQFHQAVEETEAEIAAALGPTLYLALKEGLLGYTGRHQT